VFAIQLLSLATVYSDVKGTPVGSGALKAPHLCADTYLIPDPQKFRDELLQSVLMLANSVDDNCDKSQTVGFLGSRPVFASHVE